MKTFLHTLFFFLLVTQICFAQWYQQNSPTTQNLNAVTFIDVNNGFAVGDSGTILHTIDGGVNWAIIPSGTLYNLNDICFIDSNIGYILGHSLSDGTTIVWKTTDGGDIWTQNYQGGRMNKIFFIDPNNGWMAGSISCIGGMPCETVWKTTNGGVNWTYQYGQGLTGGILTDVFFINENIGISVSGDGLNISEILKTTDGGNNWMELHSSGEESYNGVFGLSESTWFVVGNSDTSTGIVMRTSDGGTNWDYYNFTPHISDALYGVHFTNLNNGFIVGTRSVIDGRVSTIYRTTNAGNYWLPEWELGAFGCGQLMDVYFVDSIMGWAVGQNVCGSNATILHTTNGGVSFVEEDQIDESPTEFLLSQNYPNPFNPSTRIQYAVSSRQFVKLTVYDLLGSEIETLVNEEKPAGNYEITWYAKQLPSGVYFYQLKAGDFIETKKMLLLK